MCHPVLKTLYILQTRIYDFPLPISNLTLKISDPVRYGYFGNSTELIYSDTVRTWHHKQCVQTVRDSLTTARWTHRYYAAVLSAVHCHRLGYSGGLAFSFADQCPRRHVKSAKIVRRPNRRNINAKKTKFIPYFRLEMRKNQWHPLRWDGTCQYGLYIGVKLPHLPPTLCQTTALCSWTVAKGIGFHESSLNWCARRTPQHGARTRPFSRCNDRLCRVVITHVGRQYKDPPKLSETLVRRPGWSFPRRTVEVRKWARLGFEGEPRGLPNARVSWRWAIPDQVSRVGKKPPVTAVRWTLRNLSSLHEYCSLCLRGFLAALRFHSQDQKATFSQPFKEECMSNVVRIGSIIIFHLRIAMKSQVLHTVLCDVISLVRLQGQFEIDHPWEWKG